MTDSATPTAIRRRIRSYVRREGRFTRAQQRALQTLLPRYGLDPEGAPLALDEVFGRHAPCTLEIGFGNGDALAELAHADPAGNYLGIEVHRPGVGHLLNRIESLELDNVRVVSGDAVDFIRQRLSPDSLDRVHIWFPDPWPKKRHHKRRLIQPDFIKLLAARMRAGGVLHLATDWADYAEHMLAVMTAAPDFHNRAKAGYSPRPRWRPLTRFEQRGERLGHAVYDLLFERRGETTPPPPESRMA